MNKSSFYSAPSYMRTDLACEAGRPQLECQNESISLVAGHEPVRISRCVETDGHRFVTLTCGRMTTLGEEMINALGHFCCQELHRMAKQLLPASLDQNTRILVVGLGNPDMTADAIGPLTVRRLHVTRHLKDYDKSLYAALGCCELSAIAPGVLGQTGMEAGALIQAAISHVHPDLLVVIDALAAQSCDRLATTLQFSDSGIAPGSGVGNHRMAIDRETMGCPVISMGIPTVVDSATLVYDALEKGGMNNRLSSELQKILENGKSFFVSPKDADEITNVSCRILSKAINQAFGVGEI